MLIASIGKWAAVPITVGVLALTGCTGPVPPDPQPSAVDAREIDPTVVRDAPDFADLPDPCALVSREDIESAFGVAVSGSIGPHDSSWGTRVCGHGLNTPRGQVTVTVEKYDAAAWQAEYPNLMSAGFTSLPGPGDETLLSAGTGFGRSILAHKDGVQYQIVVLLPGDFDLAGGLQSLMAIAIG